ncbi:MAG: L-threonylcarbamoyladenylate synthase [Candidatus Moraniibacteriota bacterium]
MCPVKLVKDKSPQSIDGVIDAINQSGVVIIPTDTVYGLSALAKDKRAVEKIYTIKKRDRKKPLIVLMKSFCMLREYCFLNQQQYNYLKKALTGKRAVTVILKNKSKELAHLVGANQTLAIRIPQQSDFLMQLLKKLKKPIVSTSLNLSGEKEILDLTNSAGGKIIKQVQFVMDVGKLKKRQPSKIVDISNIPTVKIIRK